jgi:hypothetical protein
MLENKQLLKKERISYWPWLALALALFLIHSANIVDSDEGVILNSAWNIINGRKLYLDTFEFIAPGAPYLLAGWWKFTEISYLAAAFLGYLISLSSAVGLYLITKKLNVVRWKYLAPTLFILISLFWPLVTHNNFNVAAIIWSIYFLFRGLENKKSFLFLAGLFSGLAILFTQHKGLVGAVIFIIYLVILKIKQKIKTFSLYFFMGGLILPLASLFIFWTPTILYKNIIIFPLLNYPATNFLPLGWWFISLIISLLVMAFIWPGNKGKNKLNVIFVFLLGLGLFSTSFMRADFTHIFTTLVIILPLVAMLFELYLNKLHDKKIIYILLALTLAACSLWPPFHNQGAQQLAEVINKACPNKKTIYAGPFLPGVYFLMRSLSTTPYSFLITKQNTPEQFTNALDIIAKNPPNCVPIIKITHWTIFLLVSIK